MKWKIIQKISGNNLFSLESDMQLNLKIPISPIKVQAHIPYNIYYRIFISISFVVIKY